MSLRYPGPPFIAHSPPPLVGHYAFSTADMAQLVLAIRSRPLPPQNVLLPSLADTAAMSVQPEQGHAAAPKNPKKKKKGKKGYDTTAARNRFTNAYGDNFHGLEPWIRLCRDLGVVGPLESKNQCKKALVDIHINIHDFLDAVDARARAAAADPAHGAAILASAVRVRTFDSEWSLSAYTLSNHRVYPCTEIKKCKEHPLRLLMAHIVFPRGGKARRGAVAPAVVGEGGGA